MADIKDNIEVKDQVKEAVNAVRLDPKPKRKTEDSAGMKSQKEELDNYVKAENERYGDKTASKAASSKMSRLTDVQ